MVSTIPTPPPEGPISIQTRKTAGNKAALVGMFVNLALFGMKLFAGLVTHSVAVLADAFNNLSDAGTSALTLVSFYISAKPPDEQHPFGHARFEYLFSAVASFAIIYVGIQIGLEAVDKIRHPVDTVFQLSAFLLLILSVFAKLGLFQYYRHTAKRIDSEILHAAATDSLADVLSTGAIILSLVLSSLLGLRVDGWTGLIVAVIIVKAGFDILKNNIDNLLGGGIPQEAKDELENFVLGYPGIQAVHDLIMHDYGPGRTLASLHAEVNVKDGFIHSHDTIDRIEIDAKNELGIDLIIHLDPLDFDDPRLTVVSDVLYRALLSLNPDLTFHDLRIIDSHYTTNLIFDVVVPMNCTTSRDAIEGKLSDTFQSMDPRYHCIVTFESPI